MTIHETHETHGTQMVPHGTPGLPRLRMLIMGPYLAGNNAIGSERFNESLQVQIVGKIQF